MGGQGIYDGYYVYGFINAKGEIIVEPRYYELTNFNNLGYAYGRKVDNYGVIYHKIDKNGNVEETSVADFQRRYNGISANKKDKNIEIKKEVIERKIYMDNILVEAIIPFIMIILPIIIIKKIIKKEEKSDSSNIK